MLLRYYLDENGKRVYTLKATQPNGDPTLNAHPGFHVYQARFSPDDKFSLERIALKERFELLPTQQPPIEF